MLLETASQPLARALTVSSMADFFGLPPPDGSQAAVGEEPGGGQDSGLTGIYNGGFGGDRVANRLFLMPFGQGDVGMPFWMRVVGWRVLSSAPSPGGLAGVVWLPTVLAEFQCQLSAQTGPSGLLNGALGGQRTTRLLTDSERLCDGIAVVRGQLGLGGYVANPGANLYAYAFLDLCGCQKFQFDFQRDQGQDVLMNCLWARA